MEKEPLLLLHGAIGSSAQFSALAGYLQKDRPVYHPDFNGHGGKPFLINGFSIPGFAAEVIDLMTKENIREASIFGYSMGGYVGMYLAKHFPEKIRSVMTLGTKFNWDENIADKESKMLDPVIIESKVPAFAAELNKRHAPGDWKELLVKTANLLKAMGKENPVKEEDYALIRQPVCIMLGDRDKMAGLDETVDVYRKLANAQLSVLPNTPHPIEKTDPERLAFEIARFHGSW